MNWHDIAGVVGKSAPMLGALLTGPAGAAVAAVGGMIANALGSDNTPDAVHAAIAADPEAALKLATLQEEGKAELNRLTFAHAGALISADTTALQVAAQDRANARQASVDGGTAKPLFVMSVVLLVITLGCEVAVLFLGYPKALSEIIVGRVLGLMDSVALIVLAFHYGTSASSQRKTELMAKATPAAEPNTATAP